MRIIDPASATELDEPRLLQVFGEEAQWMTEGDKLRLRKQGLKFADLTGYEDLSVGDGLAGIQSTWPDLQYKEKVKSVTSRLRTEPMRENLSNLTSFHNRYYRSQYGVQSSRWIYNQVLEIISKAPPSARLSIETFPHTFAQPSVIARFEPWYGRASQNPNIALPRIIVGAHQDSANYRFPLLPAPGADDDGSGTVTILEAFRALFEAGFKPERPVEFHWYAGEEGGLLGSREVVAEYVQLKKPVGAMIQFDMTAYVRSGSTPAVTFITTDVDTSLTNWTMDLASEYSTSPVKGGKLFPGAGSDHMSWYRAGFPSIFAAEGDPNTDFNPYIHTSGDRMDLANGEFSFEHALEFAKVAVGFVVELGGWVE
ncbi:Zn-dependent exopeptidase [Hygrophoropsis aurantiaca]|uniref:Zn-dependent exopeptidase n=1 Tax=Hygrophoropsis aurantiaca TaxID=72124 RepID=A0ACB8A700_9AGAM|nr:Zn-dependent exopeptidase [Hygrophoropsis aurantiaca]